MATTNPYPSSVSSPSPLSSPPFPPSSPSGSPSPSSPSASPPSSSPSPTLAPTRPDPADLPTIIPNFTYTVPADAIVPAPWEEGWDEWVRAAREAEAERANQAGSDDWDDWDEASDGSNPLPNDSNALPNNRSNPLPNGHARRASAPPRLTVSPVEGLINVVPDAYLSDVVMRNADSDSGSGSDLTDLLAGSAPPAPVLVDFDQASDPPREVLSGRPPSPSFLALIGFHPEPAATEPEPSPEPSASEAESDFDVSYFAGRAWSEYDPDNELYVADPDAEASEAETAGYDDDDTFGLLALRGGGSVDAGSRRANGGPSTHHGQRLGHLPNRQAPPRRNGRGNGNGSGSGNGNSNGNGHRHNNSYTSGGNSNGSSNGNGGNSTGSNSNGGNTPASLPNSIPLGQLPSKLAPAPTAALHLPQLCPVLSPAVPELTFASLNQFSKDGGCFRVHSVYSRSPLKWTGTAATSGFSARAYDGISPTAYPSRPSWEGYAGSFLASTVAAHVMCSTSDQWISCTTNLRGAVWAIARALHRGATEVHMSVISPTHEHRARPTFALKHAGSSEKYTALENATKAGEVLFLGRIFSESILYDTVWTSEAMPFPLPAEFWRAVDQRPPVPLIHVGTRPPWTAYLAWHPTLSWAQATGRMAANGGHEWHEQPVRSGAYCWPPSDPVDPIAHASPATTSNSPNLLTELDDLAELSAILGIPELGPPTVHVPVLHQEPLLL